MLVEGGQLLLHRRTWHCTYSTAVGVVADGVMRMNTDFDDDLASLHPSSDNMTVEKYNFIAKFETALKVIFLFQHNISYLPMTLNICCLIEKKKIFKSDLKIV